MKECGEVDEIHLVRKGLLSQVMLELESGSV